MHNGVSDVNPLVSTEAIVVVDIIESTATSNLYGWNSVGRSLMRELRRLIVAAAASRGIQCIKSVGDAFLVTFQDARAAHVAVEHAIAFCFELMNLLRLRNERIPEERRIEVRFALHFGEVDVVENDREGPHVSYAFRIERISFETLAGALNAIPAEQFPLTNYLLCSEEVRAVVQRHGSKWAMKSIGLFKLKGFTGWREIFLVSCPSSTTGFS
jgi:class 3 adenylate cyclase